MSEKLLPKIQEKRKLLFNKIEEEAVETFLQRMASESYPMYTSITFIVSKPTEENSGLKNHIYSLSSLNDIDFNNKTIKLNFEYRDKYVKFSEIILSKHCANTLASSYDYGNGIIVINDLNQIFEYSNSTLSHLKCPLHSITLWKPFVIKTLGDAGKFYFLSHTFSSISKNIKKIKIKDDYTEYFETTDDHNIRYSIFNTNVIIDRNISNLKVHPKDSSRLLLYSENNFPSLLPPKTPLPFVIIPKKAKKINTIEISDMVLCVKTDKNQNGITQSNLFKVEKIKKLAGNTLLGIRDTDQKLIFSNIKYFKLYAKNDKKVSTENIK